MRSFFERNRKQRESYPVTKILFVLTAIILCVIFSFIAIFGLYFYIREIFIASGSDDKSLLFWYLPLLFAGVISAPLAAGAAVVARKTIKSLSKPK